MGMLRKNMFDISIAMMHARRILVLLIRSQSQVTMYRHGLQNDNDGKTFFMFFFYLITQGEELGHMDIHVTQSFTVIFLILKVFHLKV